MARRTPHLASRLQGLGATIFATMSQLATETGSINLGQGFPDTDGPAEIAEAAVEAIRAGHNQYPPGTGIPALRHAVADHQREFWGLDYDPQSEVLVTAGATEAMAAAILALCEVGDEVVAFEPFYDAYAAVVAMAGASLIPVELRAPDWSFDEADLASAISPRTRAIILNSPHNPTGKVFSRDELAVIAKICVEADLIALTDEVYEHMVFSGEHLPLAGFPGMRQRTIAISSAAKTYSFTGWKIGWVTATPELVSAVRTTKQFLTYVNGAPFQVAVAHALEAGRLLTDLAPSGIAPQRATLIEGLDADGLAVLPSEGTYFLTTDITPVTSMGAARFCTWMAHNIGVVAVPASAFYATPGKGDSLVRWTFCKRPEVIEQAVERLAKLRQMATKP